MRLILVVVMHFLFKNQNYLFLINFILPLLIWLYFILFLIIFFIKNIYHSKIHIQNQLWRTHFYSHIICIHSVFNIFRLKNQFPKLNHFACFSFPI